MSPPGNQRKWVEETLRHETDSWIRRQYTDGRALNAPLKASCASCQLQAAIDPGRGVPELYLSHKTCSRQIAFCNNGVVCRRASLDMAKAVVSVSAHRNGNLR